MFRFVRPTALPALGGVSARRAAPLALASRSFVALSLLLACSGSSRATDPPSGPPGADDATEVVEPADGTASDADDTSSVASDVPDREDTMTSEDPVDDSRDVEGPVDRAPVALRVATWNASMFREAPGSLQTSLASGDDPHAASIARVLQHLRPDILLLNEFDGSVDDTTARAFASNFLAVAQDAALEPIEYPWIYVPASNTGEPSGVDLDNSGSVVSTPLAAGYGNDCYGFGQFPGQYGMAIFSRYPLRIEQARTFRLLRWVDLPGHRMPLDWYSEEAAEVLRLSSKNHVVLPVDVEGRTLHLLASHPTPPAFDGPEGRNRLRNHDEIALWTRLLDGGTDCDAIVDDGGQAGCLPAELDFVILGDLNSDPFDGSGIPDAIRALLAHPRVRDTRPASDGAVESADREGLANWEHRGDPAVDTARFNPRGPGNLRVDYALPSATLDVDTSGVFWPIEASEWHPHVSVSDHRPVWVDLRF